MSKIDDVLEQQVYPYYELQYHDEAKEHIKYIKQALYKDMVELIGEDDDVQWDTEGWFCNNCDWQPVDGSKTCLCKIRNRLRQELRIKLKEYYGVN